MTAGLVFALSAASLLCCALATEAACAAGAGPAAEGGSRSCRDGGIASGEVLLLQKHYSASLATSSGAVAEKTPCHTAVEEEGDDCYIHVKWALTSGIQRFPDWYPSLSSASTFEEFQAFLHQKGHGGCPAPCTTTTPAATTSVSSTTTPAATTSASSTTTPASATTTPESSTTTPLATTPEATTPAVTTTPGHPAHPQGDVRIKVSAFNVYYAALGRPDRTNGIGDAIAHLGADIAVITEQWNEKPAILARARATSGRNYKFCDSGPQEKWWDGDILYDDDLWMNLKDGVKDWGANRGLSWALLQHRERGHRLFVYGAHPVCCGNEKIHLQNALDFAAHVQTHPEWSEVPVVYMGDFNALEDWSSTKLYKTGSAWAYKKHWHLPMQFDDTFREPRANRWKDATTHNSGARLDYIFTEKRNPPVFQTLSASIWRHAPGGSDHYPISAEILLKR